MVAFVYERWREVVAIAEEVWIEQKYIKFNVFSKVKFWKGLTYKMVNKEEELISPRSGFFW